MQLTVVNECLCLHAEENALLEAGKERIGEDSILYCNTCVLLAAALRCQRGVRVLTTDARASAVPSRSSSAGSAKSCTTSRTAWTRRQPVSSRKRGSYSAGYRSRPIFTRLCCDGLSVSVKDNPPYLTTRHRTLVLLHHMHYRYNVTGHSRSSRHWRASPACPPSGIPTRPAHRPSSSSRPPTAHLHRVCPTPHTAESL